MVQLSRRQALGALGAASVLGIPALRSSQAKAPSAAARNAAAPSCFTIYDSTFYWKYTDDPDTHDDDPDVGAYLGVQKSATVYCDGWFPGYFALGKNPPEGAFKNAIYEYSSRPGPVVLNCEKLFLRDYGPDYPAVLTIQKRADIWVQMLTWARQVTDKPVGAYAFGETTLPEHYEAARGPVDLMDAFFPDVYTNSRTLTADEDEIYEKWVEDKTLKIRRVSDLDRYLHPGQALMDKIAYMWPNFYGGYRDKQFIPGTLWRRELNWLADQVNRRADGAVLWSGMHTPDIDDRGWLDATKAFLIADPCA